MQTIQWTFLVAYLSFLPFLTHAQVPDSLKADWHLSGLDSTALPPTTTVDVLTFGVVPNDGLDDRQSLISAMANMPAGGAVMVFPAGTFHFSNTVQLPSNCIVRGAGSDSTFFIFNMNNSVANSFQISGTAQNNWLPVTGGLQRGSSTLIIPGAAALFVPGNKIELEQDNGSWDTNPAVWAAGAVGHISTITGVSGDTVFMAEGLRMNFDSTLNAKARKINCVQNSGLECFRMTRVDSTAASINYGVYFSKAFNCWMKGVEGFKSVGAHVYAEASTHLEVKGCYFHESYLYDGASTHGYGVIMSSHSTLCRIENNVFRKLRHAMMVKQGANGNVFGYNYSIQPFRSEFPSDYGGDISLHGHYPFANLFEGNSCKNAAIDQAWGPNGPYNAVFRNRIELYGLTISSGSVQSNQQTLVGNDIPSTAFFQGQYALNGSGHFQYGNRVQGNILPAGTSNLTDSSLYLDEPPSFWTGGLPWPSIGIPYAQQPNLVPAASRYLSGLSPATCNETPISTNLSSNENTQVDFSVFWSSPFMNIQFTQPKSGFCNFSLYDMNGSRIAVDSKFFESGSAQHRMSLAGIQQGVYLLIIDSDHIRYCKRVLSHFGN